ncbi:hypothetical protein ACFLRB_03190 [Acidobacteriota bacterium]
MTLPKKTFPSVFIILFNILALFLLNSCKDIIFNNPLDPEASAEAVQIINVITTSLGGKGDICFDGEKFWKIESYGNLNTFDIESGTIIRNYSVDSGTGVIFFDNKLYTCSGENILISLDPLSGEILNHLSTTDLYPGFLTTDFNSLIIYDQRSSSFFEYDIKSGSSNRLFQVSGLAIGGIEIYGEGILVTDMNSDSIYYFAINGTIINVFRSPASDIGGITVDSRNYVYLFTLDGKIYKISLP